MWNGLLHTFYSKVKKRWDDFVFDSFYEIGNMNAERMWMLEANIGAIDK